ncbi:MAG: aminopeptidase P family N-terminal domain-containing protein, partial [Phycisphaerae bacterium]|nr:aminopeptidase P family N-terminal domain-containing protein [Phycisphaerae bacterium]
MKRRKESGIPTHLLVRHARIRESLLSRKLDAILLTAPADVGYVTGVPWDDCLVLLDHDGLVLLT